MMKDTKSSVDPNRRKWKQKILAQRPERIEEIFAGIFFIIANNSKKMR
jgi:hypothetical protein